MLLDANLLLFAVDDESPFHAASKTKPKDWLTKQLNTTAIAAWASPGQA